MSISAIDYAGESNKPSSAELYQAKSDIAQSRLDEAKDQKASGQQAMGDKKTMMNPMAKMTAMKDQKEGAKGIKEATKLQDSALKDLEKGSK